MRRCLQLMCVTYKCLHLTRVSVCLFFLAGDHCYKQNKEKTDREQMITSLPDVKCLTLSTEDQFMVIACDGIW